MVDVTSAISVEICHVKFRVLTTDIALVMNRECEYPTRVNSSVDICREVTPKVTAYVGLVM